MDQSIVTRMYIVVAMIVPRSMESPKPRKWEAKSPQGNEVRRINNQVRYAKGSESSKGRIVIRSVEE